MANKVKFCPQCGRGNIKRDLVKVPLPIVFGLFEQLEEPELAQHLDDLIHECARRNGYIAEVAAGV